MQILRSILIGGFSFFAACETLESDGSSTPTFERLYGGTGDDAGSCLITDGTTLVWAGTTESHGQSDVMVAKITDLGDTIWVRRFGDDSHEFPRRIIRLSGGAYLIAGESAKPDSAPSILILHVASNGSLIDRKTVMSGVRARDVSEHSSGDILVAGVHEEGSRSRGFLARMTSAGVLSWSKSFGGSGLNGFTGLLQISGNRLLCLGHREVGENSRDFWTLQTSMDGDSLWGRTFGTSGDDLSNRAQRTSDGTLFLLGNTDLFGDLDGYAVRLNEDGDSLWSRTFGALQEDDLASITWTADGGFVLCGFTNSFGVGGDLWLTKISTTGSSIWNQTLGGPGLQRGFDLVELFDGSLMTIGETSAGASGGSDVYLIRTDQFGQITTTPL